MSIESRFYEGDADRKAIIQLITRVRPTERLAEYPSLIDLQELFSLPEVRKAHPVCGLTRLGAWSVTPSLTS